MRAIYSDSAVKGSNNEKIVAGFLSEHIQCNFISSNNQIIDSMGGASDEVDICVCNSDQPFRTKTGELILCEGVDFVVQVKAVISNNEIDRIIKNCKSVKQLNRQLTLGVTVKGHEANFEHMIQRIPYIVFAFDSKTSIESLFIQLRQRLQNVELSLQPDAIFILDKGYFINLRKGDGAPVKANDILLKGIVGFKSPDFILLEMIRYLNTYLPKITRNHSPISYYHSCVREEMTIYNEQLIKQNIIKALQNISLVKLEELIQFMRSPDKSKQYSEQIIHWASQLSFFLFL